MDERLVDLYCIHRIGSEVDQRCKPSSKVIERDADPAFRPYARQKLPFPSVLVASRDDPYSSLADSEALARQWGAQLLDAGSAGHLNAESGHGPWPEGLLQFAAFMKRL